MAEKDAVKTEQNNNSITTKARYWVGIGWLENMLPDWENRIAVLMQVPYAYVVHDKDVDSSGQLRPKHVHILFAFPNTTTYKAALAVIRQLELPGRQAFNTVFKVHNVRNMYEYLIHNTDDARKKHKHQYEPAERIHGNGFDIGLFEQISQADKDRMLDELEDVILEKCFVTYGAFFLYVKFHMSAEHRKLMRSYSSHLVRLVQSNLFEREQARREQDSTCEVESEDE